MHISDFSNCELIALANSIALSLSHELPNEDLIKLAAFFTTIGDELALLSL